MSNDKYEAAMYGDDPLQGYQPLPAQVYPRPKKRWPLVVALVAILAFALCGLGALALGSFGHAVQSNIEQQATDNKADVKLTSCLRDKVLDGVVTVGYTVTNSGSGTQSYMPTFNFVADNDKAVIGTAVDFVNDLEAGGVYKGKATGTLSDPNLKFACALVSA